MTIEQLKAAHAREAPEPTPIAFAMVLSVSVGTALTLLVAWHTYLILTAQVRTSPFVDFVVCRPELVGCNFARFELSSDCPSYTVIKQHALQASALSTKVRQQRCSTQQPHCLQAGCAKSALRDLIVLMPTQSTIDFYQNRKLRQAARASGGTWVNPYDLGPAANWQVC